jgi:predicted ATP-dependent endonuclease of OLD family
MPSFINSWGGVVLIIKSIQVKNFRSIKDETLYCDKLTALVGANGSGKSSFLHALELFQSKSPKVELDDYYNRNIQDDIVIRVTFSNLSQSATELFKSYMQNNELVVERIFKWDGSKAVPSYHGSLLQNPDFVEIYNLSASEAKKKYDELKQKSDYQRFPALSSHTKIKEFLKSWESSNPTKCTRMSDDGQFFGFTEVAKGHLGKFIRFLYIPAVREASNDASEGGRSSVLTELMDIAIRNKLSEKPEIKEFQEDTKKRYSEIMNPTNLPEIKDLAAEMTKTLRNFVPSAEINLSWGSIGEFEVKIPDAVAKLIEDGYQSTVNRTGHGLQRAFIMTILQHLDSVKTGAGVQADNQPTLVMIIEEPELYQHPNRQRHLAKVFLSLSERGISGVSSSMQIVYSTHSPHFVGIDRIDQIRLLRKIPPASQEPKITKIYSTKLDKVAEELGQLSSNGTQFTGNSLKPRLHVIMTPWMNEGFFSDVVVLVEGETDRSAILGVAASLGHDLESLGISVIPCYGKQNLDRPYIIFRNLGIPVFLMWDSDKGEKNTDAVENHQLLVLLGQKKEDWPNKVEKNFACFETNMDTVLKNEISETLFNSCMGECEQEFAMGQGKGRKNPMVIPKIIEKAREKGGTSPTIEKIVKNILELKNT